MSTQTDFLTRHLQEMAPHRAILRSVEAKFMSQVSMPGPILDIGCGDGHFASVAYTDPIDVGLDLLDRDLAEAAGRRPAVYRDLVRGSATRMPFGDGVFGTVISNCALEHIPDIDAALSEISRVLRAGGTFATTLPSEHYPEFLLGSTLARRVGFDRLAYVYGQFFNRISHHYHVYPPAIWRAKFESLGLEVIDHHYYFSPEAHRTFDAAHYLGVPNLLSKRLFGEWVLHPLQAKPLEWWYRRYYDEPIPDAGAYQFFRCIKGDL